MIKPPLIPSLGKSHYTTLLKDLDNDTKSLITNIFSTFIITGINSPALLEEQFYSLWNFYEINDNDKSIFIQTLQDTYNEHRDYYKELLTNYLKEYDYSTGNRHTTTRNDSESTSKTRTSSGSNYNGRKEYDLPNKTVNPSDESGYLTGKVINTETSEDTSEEEGNSEVNGTTTTVYGEQFLRLKREYLNQIRNIYREFAQRFSDSFLHIY